MDDAVKLINGFISRTFDNNERYLWTDAFAVQTLFALTHITESDEYKDRAIRLIDDVHNKLGRFSSIDVRKGWISNLSEEQGKLHPTIGGLRIGKKLSERKPEEPYNERLEWEREGQYFHYITRWINALLQAYNETQDKQYLLYAAELVTASAKFIYKSGQRIGMYWKMSIDLSRPQVSSMGGHDPMEGLICCLSVSELLPEKKNELKPIISDFKVLCDDRNWATSDSLGIGGLLLSTARAAELSAVLELPESVKPEKLLKDSLYSLSFYEQEHRSNFPADYRLAFRECGLSLGLRVLSGINTEDKINNKKTDKLKKYLYLADEIESFWMETENRSSATWKEHLNINSVTLAASIEAKDYPYSFI